MSDTELALASYIVILAVPARQQRMTYLSAPALTAQYGGELVQWTRWYGQRDACPSMCVGTPNVTTTLCVSLRRPCLFAVVKKFTSMLSTTVALLQY